MNTIPQGQIDMNVCSDVFDAEAATGHDFAICVATDNSKTYIKGVSREEINRCDDVTVAERSPVTHAVPNKLYY